MTMNRRTFFLGAGKAAAVVAVAPAALAAPSGFDGAALLELLKYEPFPPSMLEGIGRRLASTEEHDWVDRCAQDTAP